MNKSAAKLRAKLKWETACERLSFALHPPSGLAADGAVDLEMAVQLAQAALEEVRAAFKVDPSAGEDEGEAED